MRSTASRTVITSSRLARHRKEVTIMTFSVGMYVVNLDYVAVIRDVRSDGTLVLENPRVSKWIADPEKCRVYNA